ncbi:hypothetical protein [Paracoccus sp. SY]|uniref:hypothetical protein n=1 Tax=Paracoccus sp. SY TaxID=1330255 RepID=UPI0011AF3B5F|nr:hypothetical protein [Paracoccus sp. SY]
MSADLIFSALFLTGSNVIDRVRGASESSKLPRICPVLAPSEQPPCNAAENPPPVQGPKASAAMGANIALFRQEDYNSGHDR